MAGTNEDFDLPRWQTYHYQDSLSSSAQAAQAAQAVPQSSFTNTLYSAAPPPPPQALPANSSQRLPPSSSQQSHSVHTPSRQPRLSQLLDEEQSIGHQYLSSGQAHLSRSASLGSGPLGVGLGSRGRRHHVPDDLERAFSTENSYSNQTHRPQLQASTGMASQYPTSLYPSSVAYHQTSQQLSSPITANPASPASGVRNDPYQDAGYYGSPGHGQPHRSHTNDQTKSPRRAGPAQPGILLDPYAHQPAQSQTQYSPTSTGFQYPHSTEVHSTHQGSPYLSHPQTQGHAYGKNSTPTSPLASPYGAHNPLPPPALSSSQYPPSYPMDTTSPGPSMSSSQSTSHLNSYSHPSMAIRSSSISSPNTPIHNQSSHAYYYPGTNDPSAMAVEVPHRRRAPGLKKVHDSRDLQPYVNPQPSGRRQDSNGNFLSVRTFLVIFNAHTELWPSLDFSPCVS